MSQVNVDAAARAPGKKAGRKPAFTEDDVLAAVFDERLDRFTMAAIARRLGVVTPAIYRLFPSREEIVVACLDRIAGGIRLPENETDWGAVLRLWADECWRVCEDFPGLSRVVYDYAPAFTRIEGIIAEYARALAVHGKTAGQAMFALDFIGDTVFACHLGVESLREVDGRGVSGFDRVKDAVASSSIIEPRESWRERGVVDAKIEFILVGLEHHWPEI
ncbi:TetR family transcriptional regulator [Gordonia pseudamarae]|jgi:AcrR family transcriptional regulator|uniref:TetR family transcriptional regulator n=1 Tax=Gordonia pseudamarae TaxID=2831662 RepID=A0ABX6IN08_9ACTN|nr:MULTISPECIES: TetR/AcrR family transcriptional regulator [Gordonia]MBD0022223.1 TetR/AcrR family transcriptional regulator [Gordonia sp. (in: high G+C Gram-positive bacteria)]QHN28236.1 TetR family transcriptional regulator [Gordonia pseudamarae]QHN37096.1 TetR family transcriptional regulator [Gordonia pseudamarae]